MNKLRRLTVACAFAGVIFVGGSLDSSVQAQQPAPMPSIDGGAGVAVDVTVRSTDPGTPEQKLAWVADQTTKARQSKITVQNMLDQARREKDTIKITCLDDKLTQMNVNIRGIEERTVGLETAVRANDEQGASQQFTILKVYVVRVQGLMAEAENCIGDVDVVLGESETTVTVDDDITVEDPSTPSVESPVDPSVDQPPHRSAYF